MPTTTCGNLMVKSSMTLLQLQTDNKTGNCLKKINRMKIIKQYATEIQ